MLAATRRDTSRGKGLAHDALRERPSSPGLLTTLVFGAPGLGALAAGSSPLSTHPSGDFGFWVLGLLSTEASPHGGKVTSNASMYLPDNRVVHPGWNEWPLNVLVL